MVYCHSELVFGDLAIQIGSIFKSGCLQSKAQCVKAGALHQPCGFFCDRSNVYGVWGMKFDGYLLFDDTLENGQCMFFSIDHECIIVECIVYDAMFTMPIGDFFSDILR